MNELHIYPTSRALRNISSTYKEQGGFLPSLMRMDEFEKRLILLDGKSLVDPLQRILFLREAASFDTFEALNVDRDLIRFFTRSDAIFKFFEELAAEKISFEKLSEADAYTEFDMHLGLLSQLLENYKHILNSRGFSDKAFIPTLYKINEGFIQNYQRIEIFLEGYLSHFEMELIERASQVTELIIHYNTSRFNKKMQERFAGYGVKLHPQSYNVIDFSAKRVLQSEKNELTFDAEVYEVKERTEQIAVAFAKIEELVQEGMRPEDIVLILPDESFKTYFSLYDTLNNLNFAMGYDYTELKAYKRLEALYAHWRSFDKKSRALIECYGMDTEKIDQFNPSKRCSVETFIHNLAALELLDAPLPEEYAQTVKNEKINERVYEKLLGFIQTFSGEELSSKEWLFLWMKALSTLTQDDVRGGKITVMGVLETRGVSFDGVVIVDFNDGIVPASSSKDQFLNSSVRAFAGLPTKSDREALQKQYYNRLLEQAKHTVILYATADNKLPSKFLYELGLDKAKQANVELDLLYSQPSQQIVQEDPIVEHFDALAITWSASRLKTYLLCKRKYYYRYIQKIEAKAEEELNEGAFLHKLLEELFKEQHFFKSSEEMREKMDKLMDALLPHEDAKTKYQKMLWREKLKGFIDRQITHFKAGWSVVEREKEVIGVIGGLKFKGRIDRIDQDATHTLVLDYKSGSTTEAQKSKNIENLTDFQMSIYHQILQPKYQNISLAFVKLFEEGKIEEITALEEKNALLAEHIIELKQTTSFVAQKCESLQSCKYCEFALMCERGEYL